MEPWIWRTLIVVGVLAIIDLVLFLHLRIVERRNDCAYDEGDYADETASGL